MFVGKFPVEKEMMFEDDETMVELSFDETVLYDGKPHAPVKIKKVLYELIQSEEAMGGDVEDRVRTVLCARFLGELAEFGLEYRMVSTIGQGIETLAHNAREASYSKRYNCGGFNGVPISEILLDF